MMTDLQESGSQRSASDDVTVISPQRTVAVSGVGLRELWAYRELVLLLAWRDVKIRYKQTVIGAAWAVLQPFLTMVVFSVFFGRLAGIPSDGVPYPIFSYTGLLPWTLFAEGLRRASDGIVGNAGLISKVYFPRVVIPLSTITAGIVDFAFSFIVLVGMLVYYHIPLRINILFLPFFLIIALLTSLGVGLWLSAINVKYRDVRYTVGFLTQLWMYATPVIYPATMLHGPWRILLALNPMTGVVEGSRWALLGTNAAPSGLFWVSLVGVAAVLVSGVWVFHRMERTFADVV